MNIILLPIQKEHSEHIFNGSKKYEYRRSFPGIFIDKIMVYESRGCGLAVGELEVLDILYTDIAELWKQTSKEGGISKKQFEEYFNDKEKGYAVKIGEVSKYESGRPLSEYGLQRAPQNYVWIERS